MAASLLQHEGVIMKKALYLALALMGATATAIAQQGTPPAGGAKSGQSFEQRKEQMLKGMEERMQAMQKTHDCIQQAKDDKAARACRSERGQRGPRGGKIGGDPK
jgi:Spy/CpxP family protein refolding chaperone